MRAGPLRVQGVKGGWAVLIALGVLLGGLMGQLIRFLISEDVDAGWTLALIASPVMASAAAHRMAKGDWPRQPARSIAATATGAGVALVSLCLAVFLFGVI